MLSTLFWIALIATIALGVTSKGKWEAYHRGQATRVELTNRITAAIAAGAATAGLWVVKAVTHLP